MFFIEITCIINIMDINYNADVIVVGAGPCGISAALEVARAGKKVVLLDRAKYAGSKNMYGGAIYKTALKEVFQDDFDTLPYERIINSHSWAFLNDTGSFSLTYQDSCESEAYAVKRFNLEKWMIEIIKKKGVYFAPNTLVKNLVMQNEYVVGVETELEKYYAPIVILADGVNSLLAKGLNLREKYKPKDVILSAKETIKLDKKIIEERFNLKEDLTNGVTKMYLGNPDGIKNVFMMGFLYTFKDTIMLGVGANLSDLVQNKININKLLEYLKNHNDIKPLIKDGQTLEYSAHLIPETGYNKMPKLTDNGVIVAGDAAGFVNSVHFEGTNYALISGKLAGKTALCALENSNFSQEYLSLYKKELDKSFILKDLYTYRNIIDRLYDRRASLMNYYPYKMKEFFKIVTSANCKSKSLQFREYFLSFFKDRNLKELIKDSYMAFRCVLDIFFGR